MHNEAILPQRARPQKKYDPGATSQLRLSQLATNPRSLEQSYRGSALGYLEAIETADSRVRA